MFPLSDAGFPPEIWGPHAWALMHLVACTYPTQPTPEDKTRYRAYYLALGGVLPCPGCRVGYAHVLAETVPLTTAVLADRMSLFAWTVQVHNAVNAKLGKRVDNDVVRWYRMYDKYRSA